MIINVNTEVCITCIVYFFFQYVSSMCESMLHTGPWGECLTLTLGNLVGRTKDRRRRDLSLCGALCDFYESCVCARARMCVYSAHFCVGARPDVSIDNSLLRSWEEADFVKLGLEQTGRREAGAEVEPGGGEMEGE